ncbi:MAG: prepilin-type N-terminal cleavage/methylation domain-containing protein [Oligosphaeraceae bacterium]|nr:prepilin-type N-terminal cleavage/methylation domain-containing protein [Oligosphaeraceae bacterium]
MPINTIASYPRGTRRHCFTLVELMVALIIIGVLLLVLAPAFNRLMTGNAVSSAERMLSSQFALARAEAASRRCEVAIVIYDENTAAGATKIANPSSFRAAYNNGGTWEWLPGSQQTWLPTGAVVGRVLLGTAADVPAPVPGSPIPDLPNTTTGVTVQIDGVDFPAVIFKPNGRLAQDVVLTIIEAVYIPGQGLTARNDNYCRILEVSQYTGRVTISQKEATP